MKIREASSPNWNERPRGVTIDGIVLHADSAGNASSSVSWIASAKSKVSYHALVDRDGTVWTFVPTEKRAWHAGVSTFKGRGNCNDYCVGLSFANRNDGKEPYTDAQYEAGAKLAASWMLKHRGITLDRITTHAIVSPGRKTDPKGFDLPRFLKLVGEALTCSVEES